MSFSRSKNIGLGLIVIILILVGLIPTLSVLEVNEQNRKISLLMQRMELSISLEEHFWNASRLFDEIIHKSTGTMDGVIEGIDECFALLKSLVRLGEHLSEYNADRANESVKKLERILKIFRTAALQYGLEASLDISSDNTEQLEDIASQAQNTAVQTLAAYMRDLSSQILRRKASISTVIRVSQMRALTGLVIGVIVAILLSLLLSKALSRPIRKLLDGATKISGGDLSLIIDIEGNDPIAHLGHAFNDMTRKLSDQAENQKRLLQETREAKEQAEITSKDLEKTNKSLEVMMKSMPFGIILVDRKKVIRFANHTALAMMGYAEDEEVNGTICHQHICPAEIDHCPIIDLKKKVERSEKVLLKKDGSEVPIIKTVIEIHLDGEPLLLEAFTDIRKIKAAQESAEKANAAKSDFLANMSHELRTPLNHIIGFTELVIDKHFGDLNPKQEEYLRDILGSSEHLLSLINDILDLSKVEAGKEVLELTEVSIRSLLNNSLAMVKEKALKHGLKLSLDLNGTPETIEADERKLKQIMFNLLSNAVKFTDDSGQIQVSSKLISQDETREIGGRKVALRKGLQISVRDSGIGMDKEDLGRIFLHFEQIDNSKSKEYPGTGLGLALTRNLVELHGGSIWAESDGMGKGSCFRFTIPLGD